jgi:hypothetical protein
MVHGNTEPFKTSIGLGAGVEPATMIRCSVLGVMPAAS